MKYRLIICMVLGFTPILAATAQQSTVSASEGDLDRTLKSADVSDADSESMKKLDKVSQYVHDQAFDIFRIAVGQYGLERALRAQAGLHACGNDALADTLNRVILKIDSLAQGSFLSTRKYTHEDADYSQFDKGGELVRLAYRQLQIGYEMGYGSSVSAMLESESKVGKRAVCDSYTRLANEALSNIGKPWKPKAK